MMIMFIMHTLLTFYFLYSDGSTWSTYRGRPKCVQYIHPCPACSTKQPIRFTDQQLDQRKYD